MRILTRIIVLTLVGLFATSLVAESAFADPPQGRGQNKNKGKNKNRGKHKTNVVVVVQPQGNMGHGHAGGPPPWAPAHGYRSHNGGYYGGSSGIAYAAPYGISGGHCNRKEVGILIGAIGGGLIGSKVAGKGDKTLGIIGGAILGAVIGGKIGNSMDKADQNCVGQTLEHAPDSQNVQWTNPDNGASYEVTPVRTYQDQNQRYCREYQTISTVDGRRQETYGTACRDDGGSWQLMS